MQNEPNFIPKAPTKHTKDADFTPIFHSLLHSFTHQMQTFPHKSQKNGRLLQLFDTNILNSMYNKGLQNFSPRNTLHNSPDAKYKKMQNEPNLQNFKNRVPRIVHREYAKQTQSQPASDERRIICKTNPIYNKNSPKCLRNNDLWEFA